MATSLDDREVILARDLRLSVRPEFGEALVRDGVFLAPELVAATERLKLTGSRRVDKVALVSGSVVVVKTYPPRRGPEGWMTWLPGRLATDHEWSHGRAMEAAGLPVARPLAVGWRRRGPGREGFLVTGFLDGAEELLAVLHGRGLHGRERHRVTRALGRLWRRLHDAGFVHEDPHLGNVMLGGTAAEPELFLIDLRRIGRADGASSEARRRNLVRLYESFGVLGSRADRHRFLAAYLGEVPRGERGAWAREVEARAVAFLAAFRWRRSRAALKTNRGFERVRRGELLWHRRRGEDDPLLERVIRDPDGVVAGAEEELKVGRSARVVATGRWVVKRDNLKRWRRRLRERWITGRARRALRLSWYLEMARLGTPRIALAGERRAFGRVVAAWLVMHRVAGARRVDDALRATSGRARARFLEDVARFVARMHRARLVHRDLKAGNLLVDQDGRLHLIDLDGLAFVRAPREARQRRDLERLLRDLRSHGGLTEDEERAFLETHRRALASRVGGA